MKRYITIALLLFYTCTAKSQVLNVPVVIQENDQWCWAGCTKCVFNYYADSIQQCSIAEYARSVITWYSFGSTNCCVDPTKGCNYWNYMYGAAGSIEDILTHFDGISNSHTGPLTLTDMRAEAAKFHPAIFHWSWYGGGGHFVVGSGVDASDNVHYMNPWFGEGAHISTHSWMLDDGSHNYDITLLMDVCPPVDPGTISGASTVCIGSKITLTDATPYGIWSSTTGKTTIVNGVVTAVGGGVDTVKYTIVNPCGVYVATKVVTVNPDPGTIKGSNVSNTLCKSKQMTLSDAIAGGTWSTANATAKISATGVLTGVAPGTDTVFYAISSACGISKASLPVTITDCHLGAATINNTEAELQVYPNPNNGTFNVNLLSASDIKVHVAISDMVGACVMEYEGTTNQSRNISIDQPTGIYVLSAVTENGRYIAKMIVNH